MAYCHAKAKSTGKQCTRLPVPGAVVCRFHGGAAPQVRAKAAERLADLIDPDRALREAARLAYSDIGELFDDAGRLKPIKVWPDHLRSAVASVKSRKYNAESGDGKQEDIVEVKVWDKPKALEMLFKHLKLYEERSKIDATVTIKWQE